MEDDYQKNEDGIGFEETTDDDDDDDYQKDEDGIGFEETTDDDYQKDEDGIGFEETTDDDDDDDKEIDDWKCESVESGQKTLSLYRFDMENLFKDWDLGPFRPKESICYSYMLFLRRVWWDIHVDKSDVTADLNILEDLKTNLKRDLVEGERDFFEVELAIICAPKKLGMMLQKLDTIIPDNDFRKWIQEKRHHLGWQEDFQKYLKILESRARYILPKEFVDQLNSLELDVEINVDNPDGIRNQLTEYLEEEEAAYKRPRGKEERVPRVPDMLETIEDTMCKLRDIYSEMEIKEERLGGAYLTIDRAVDGFQPAILADDGVKLDKLGKKGLKRKKMT